MFCNNLIVHVNNVHDEDLELGTLLDLVLAHIKDIAVKFKRILISVASEKE